MYQKKNNTGNTINCFEVLKQNCFNMTITHYKQICNNIFLNIESFGLIEVKFAQIEDLMFRFNYKVDTLHGGNSIK